MKITQTNEMKNAPKINLLVYGEAKVGKSTFATTAPKVLIGDAESGYRYMGTKGIDVPVATLGKWSDMKEFFAEASKPEYETIVIDPVNEILEKLMKEAKTNSLYIQNTDRDALSMKGWGYVKGKMKEMLKAFRDLNKNVIFIAHVKSTEDGGQNKKTPRLDANLSSDLMAMMDIIGFFSVINKDNEEKRVLAFKPSVSYDAGDRTGTLPEFFNASEGFPKMYEILLANKVFAKSKEVTQSIKEKEKDFLDSMPPSHKDKPKEVEEIKVEPVKEKPLSNPTLEAGKKKLQEKLEAQRLEKEANNK